MHVHLSVHIVEPNVRKKITERPSSRIQPRLSSAVIADFLLRHNDVICLLLLSVADADSAA